MIPVNDLARHTEPLASELAHAAAGVIASGWYSLGPHVRQFESAFAGYCGAPYCIGVGNGTDALELALRACGAGAGKRVVTVANAGGYSTTAILAAGAEPAYVDIDPATMLMDPKLLPDAITPGVAAVVVTHLYGRMADMSAVLEIAEPRGIPVIEDCAQAHGARIHGRLAGTWGTAGCFSFYPTKNLGALGDGGAVVTRDAGVADRVRELRQYGWSQRYRNRIAGGRNSRLDELQAALLLRMLPRLDAWNDRRRAIAACYSAELRDMPLELPPAGEQEYVAHLYVIRAALRDSLRQQLAARGIGTDVHYPLPDHRQIAWAGETWARVHLEHTENAAARVLTLPCFPEMTEQETACVVQAIRDSMLAL